MTEKSTTQIGKVAKMGGKGIPGTQSSPVPTAPRLGPTLKPGAPNSFKPAYVKPKF